MEEGVYLKYVGKGDFMVGIPARDLFEWEVRALGGERFLVETGLYQRVSKDEQDKSDLIGRKGVK
jgi:hypothetical protein